ncbi:MAG TPA: NosD domain-containing protein, partial [Pyrinomonadaceae bacterium]|nr:NosD domain-containing protein [Pyrinomonadaceae bacterium]
MRPSASSITTASGDISGAASTGNSVRGNIIGLDYQRNNDLGNSRNGITIADGPSNTVGGIGANDGNWIGGNNQFGVEIPDGGSNGNTIQGNKIGFNTTGAARPQNDGLRILTDNNMIGGPVTGARNYIAGHPQFGIALAFGTGNTVQGNWIGLTLSGLATANYNGIWIQDASNNLVGGTSVGAGNVISGNTFGVRMFYSSVPTTNNIVQGNLIGTDPFGTTAAGNIGQAVLLQGANSNTIGGSTPEARNIISGNNQGISLQNSSSNNLVQGNYIGTKPDGMTSLPNTLGIQIDGSGSINNQIGGSAPGEGNLVSGNSQNGIQITNYANNNRIEGNIVGLKVDGSSFLSNANGISIFSAAHSNTIGGTAAGAGNVISGNVASGVIMIDGANNNTVAGNKIGTDPTGMLDRGNGFYGVYLVQGSTVGFFTTNNMIGGTAPGSRNLISGNNSGGVRLEGSTTTSNTVAGNYVGSDITGDGYLPNTSVGIHVEAPSNIIGGSTVAHRNVISGQYISTDAGIRIQNTGTSTIVRGNYIGTNAAGDAYLFNGSNIVVSGSNFEIDNNLISGALYGITVGPVTSGYITNNVMGTNAAQTAYLGNGFGVALFNASGVKIGETVGGTAAPNVIAGGTMDGIRINGNGTGNIIRQNSIYDNAGLGIDLGGDGVTQNDSGDPDFANNYQNFPIINDATINIAGVLNSTPFRTIRIEFFSS